MIELRKLNGDNFILNALLIEQIQSYADTTIELINGKKIVVQNDKQDVSKKMLFFYKQVGLVGTIHKIGDTDE